MYLLHLQTPDAELTSVLVVGHRHVHVHVHVHSYVRDHCYRATVIATAGQFGDRTGRANGWGDRAVNAPTEGRRDDLQGWAPGCLDEDADGHWDVADVVEWENSFLPVADNPTSLYCALLCLSTHWLEWSASRREKSGWEIGSTWVLTW